VSVRFDLLVLAELNPDVVVTTDGGEIRFGQVETQVADARITLGSSGAITASAAASLGLRVSLRAVVGTDVAGTIAMTMLRDRGVDVEGVVTRPDVATGMTVVLTRPDGDRALLTAVGAMRALTADQVSDDALREARHLHVSSVFLQEGLLAGLAGLLRSARRRGLSTSLDPGWDPAERWTLPDGVLEQVDHLLPNEAEACALARALTGDQPADVTAAAETLHRRGPTVVVKSGSNGAFVTGPARVRVLTDGGPVVDTTGAGDLLAAAWAWADGTGLDAEAGLRWAVLYAALSVTVPTGAAGAAHLDEFIEEGTRRGLPAPRSGKEVHT
jgi:sugar/nucleoside kinase (ribokinase family)